MYILVLLLSAQIKTYYLSPLTLTFIFFTHIIVFTQHLSLFIVEEARRVL